MIEFFGGNPLIIIECWICGGYDISEILPCDRLSANIER